MEALTLYTLAHLSQPRPLTFYVSNPPSAARWEEICEWAADTFDCRADEVGLIEAFWGGAHGDDNSAELLTIKGEPVGSFDSPLTVADCFAISATLSASPFTAAA